MGRGLRRGMPAVAMLVMLAFAGCSSADSAPQADSVGARAITTAESEQFAAIRFQNYRREYVPFRLTVPVEGTAIEITGRVDFVRHRLYGTYHGGDVSGVVQVTGKRFGIHLGRPEPSDPPPPRGWQTRPLDVQGNALDISIGLLFNLALDRPDNPLLLQQNGARWLGESTVGGDPVDLYSGPDVDGQPSRTTYYLGEDGLLRRMTTSVGAEAAPLTIELDPAEAEPFQLAAAMKSAGRPTEQEAQ